MAATFTAWKNRQEGNGSMTQADMRNREPYVGSVPAEHEAILIDTKLSFMEVCGKLDAKGYKANYNQIDRARHLGRAPAGMAAAFTAWKNRQEGNGSMTQADMRNREPYVGSVPAEHEAILIDTKFTNKHVSSIDQVVKRIKVETDEEEFSYFLNTSEWIESDDEETVSDSGEGHPSGTSNMISEQQVVVQCNTLLNLNGFDSKQQQEGESIEEYLLRCCPNVFGEKLSVDFERELDTDSTALELHYSSEIQNSLSDHCWKCLPGRPVPKEGECQIVWKVLGGTLFRLFNFNQISHFQSHFEKVLMELPTTTLEEVIESSGYINEEDIPNPFRYLCGLACEEEESALDVVRNEDIQLASKIQFDLVSSSIWKEYLATRHKFTTILVRDYECAFLRLLQQALISEERNWLLSISSQDWGSPVVDTLVQFSKASKLSFHDAAKLLAADVSEHVRLWEIVALRTGGGVHIEEIEKCLNYERATSLHDELTSVAATAKAVEHQQETVPVDSLKGNWTYHECTTVHCSTRCNDMHYTNCPFGVLYPPREMRCSNCGEGNLIGNTNSALVEGTSSSQVLFLSIKLPMVPRRCADLDLHSDEQYFKGSITHKSSDDTFHGTVQLGGCGSDQAGVSLAMVSENVAILTLVVSVWSSPVQFPLLRAGGIGTHNVTPNSCLYPVVQMKKDRIQRMRLFQVTSLDDPKYSYPILNPVMPSFEDLALQPRRVGMTCVPEIHPVVAARSRIAAYIDVNRSARFDFESSADQQEGLIELYQRASHCWLRRSIWTTGYIGEQRTRDLNKQQIQHPYCSCTSSDVRTWSLAYKGDPCMHHETELQTLLYGETQAMRNIQAITTWCKHPWSPGLLDLDKQYFRAFPPGHFTHKILEQRVIPFCSATVSYSNSHIACVLVAAVVCSGLDSGIETTVGNYISGSLVEYYFGTSDSENILSIGMNVVVTELGEQRAALRHLQCGKPGQLCLHGIQNLVKDVFIINDYGDIKLPKSGMKCSVSSVPGSIAGAIATVESSNDSNFKFEIWPGECLAVDQVVGGVVSSDN